MELNKSLTALSKLTCSLIAFGFFAIFNAHAEVSVANIFTDNMVLQRDQRVPVWGNASPGKVIKVRFAGQTVTGTADEDGHWVVELSPISASFEARDLIIEGDSQLRLQNVLVGEVWLGAGQSNMAMAVGVKTAGAHAVAGQDRQLAIDLEKGGNGAIRLFKVKKNSNTSDVISDGWQPANNGVVISPFSALGFIFAQALQRELTVPVGIIQSARGGTRIELWTPPEAYQQSSLFNRPPASDESFTVDGIVPGTLYNGMVKPLAPFAIKGVLWYQGESNIIANNDGLRYADKFEILINSWRQTWHQPNLPFYFVQLAPFLYSERKKEGEVYHAPTELPRLWRAQEMVLERVENTAMVPTIDLVTDLKNIHPMQKRPIAERLAFTALSHLYRTDPGVPASPRVSHINIERWVVRVTFDKVTGRLHTADGQSPDSFEIAGEDGHFVPAKAEIIGPASVLVWSGVVDHPKKIRFAWSETARPNLIDGNGWPAYPFCSAEMAACDNVMARQ
ncbi:sialate O-acetylesterase [Aestuariibacter sp. GS-14]|uniref:sialate O-acetylesterase n=1 Tax=Aestuariibacter sp. GS-14 TaxID=2590670 RepID=UPI00112C1922|nr:sialate O-acetylesterase [Aestuariibacter sp. GS-14]TPV58541.1 sialate O-acetylesterase [Aestuariibacter sp. GS-14]